MNSCANGWFRATRSRDALEVIKANPNAFVLAYIIARRARYQASFQADGVELGEAFLGDFREYGMTRQQFRTAIHHLTTWGFATTRATNRGTIAKLIDSRLFEVIPPDINQQSNQQETIKQPASNQPATTNRDPREHRGPTTPREQSKPLGTAERIGLENQLRLLKEKRQDLRDDTSEDWQRTAHPERLVQLQDVEAKVAAIEEKLLQ